MNIRIFAKVSRELGYFGLGVDADMQYTAGSPYLSGFRCALEKLHCALLPRCAPGEKDIRDMERKKDWIGNGNGVFKTLGASNHTDKEREENDFYATDPVAVDKLCRFFHKDLHEMLVPEGSAIWECACGNGLLSERLKEHGYDVVSSDIVDRGYGEECDFLATGELLAKVGCILTNPPYRYALEFVEHALELLPVGGLCAMFLKTTFLEGQKRYERLFSVNPPQYVLQFVKRVPCAKNAEFEAMRLGGGTAIAYAWFVWRKGDYGYTKIRWI